MTPEDFATILNAHDCTPVYKRQQLCGKHGAIEIFVVKAKPRSGGLPVEIGPWTRLNELSYEDVCKKVAKALQESDVKA